MKKLLLNIIILLILASCAGNAIIREYKYSYKMKSADNVLYDIITIVKNNDLELIQGGMTNQSINTTHGMFFVDIVETDWKSTGIQNEEGNEYELKYRIWVPVEGSMKAPDLSNVSDAFDDSGTEHGFSENVVSIESFIRIMENGEYKMKEAIPRHVFNYLELIPIEISDVLGQVGLSRESELRVQQESNNN